MADKKGLRNYQDEKDYTVLSLVKKYPLYSVDKLAGELPHISRRSIQGILESNNLSTAEKRLAFSTEKGLRLEKLKMAVGRPGDLIKKLRRMVKISRKTPQLNWHWIRNLTVLGVLFLVFWQGMNFVSTDPPQVNLNQPEMGLVNQGESLFVSGEVVPARSRVTVNDNEVSLNGDGSFTAVINIPLGESTLVVEAVSRGKKSRVVRLVSREPTRGELQAKEEDEVRKKRKASDKVAELERTVNDLLAAKKAVVGKEDILRVLNNHVKDEEGFYSVVGEVMNLGEEEVSWVMITANFYDQQGKKVDSKYGFATDFGQVIEPEEKSDFETQATTKEFDHYSLELSWEKGAVAGLATQAAEKATPSGEIE